VIRRNMVQARRTIREGEKTESESETTIMVINCRSVCNKMDKLRTLLELVEPHVVVATETWLEEGYTEREVTVDGYVMHPRDRDKHGGGILVGIKKEVRGTVIWKENDVEMMGLRLNAGGGVFQLIAVYNPPNGGEETLSRLEGRLSKLMGRERVIVAGDFNLPLARWEAGGEGMGKSKTQKIVTSIMNQGYVQVVREGTRKTRAGGNNILDVLLVKPKDLWIKTEVIDGISDHRVPIVKMMLGTAQDMVRERKIWNYKKANALEVKSLFKSKYKNWKGGCSDDIEEIWNDFKSICEEIREKCVPSKVVVKNTDPPYYNKKVKIIKRKCRKIYKREKRNSERGTGRTKELRKVLEKAKGEAKEQFIDQMFDKRDLQGSWNKMYKYVAGMKGNVGSIPTLSDAKGNEWDTDISKATALNNHYGKTFTKRGRERYSMQGQIRKGEDNIVTKEEIWQVIRKLKNGKSVGMDGIANELVKLAGKSILPYLEVIINLTFRTGKLPKDWKESLVVPIFKGGERGKLTNYRPVSLTSAICKIVERVIDGRIKKKLEEKGGLKEAQHGFRKEHSCETQLLGFVSDLAEVLDKGGRVDAVFLDYEKAFDKSTTKS
jgi:Endonuclease-reverse transcriptase/Reverse transcriptase (RNA-dependent DNA polymerase)